MSDKYPKAKYHFLVIPKDAKFRRATPADLTVADLPLLQRIHATAGKFRTRLSTNYWRRNCNNKA